MCHDMKTKQQQQANKWTTAKEGEDSWERGLKICLKKKERNSKERREKKNGV